MNEFKKRGLNGYFNRDLFKLLQSYRLIQCNQYAKGIAEWVHLSNDFKFKNKFETSSILDNLCLDIASSSKKMSGPEFIRLVNILHF